jgi:transposase InsO family protein
MEEADISTILQRAREAYPNERPRIISDNGPQFIAKDFKEFIRAAGARPPTTPPLTCALDSGLRCRSWPPTGTGKRNPWLRYMLNVQ